MDTLLRSKIEATRKSVFRLPAHEELRSRWVGAVSDKFTHIFFFILFASFVDCYMSIFSPSIKPICFLSIPTERNKETGLFRESACLELSVQYSVATGSPRFTWDFYAGRKSRPTLHVKICYDNGSGTDGSDDRRVTGSVKLTRLLRWSSGRGAYGSV